MGLIWIAAVRSSWASFGVMEALLSVSASTRPRDVDVDGDIDGEIVMRLRWEYRDKSCQTDVDGRKHFLPSSIKSFPIHSATDWCWNMGMEA